MSTRKPERVIQSEIMLAMSDAGSPVWRNNVGQYTTTQGHVIRYGLGGPGGADLIGVTPITVTADMVGCTVGVFTAVEVKSATGKPTKQQVDFIAAVRRLGGLAGVARSADDALHIISTHKPK